MFRDNTTPKSDIKEANLRCAEPIESGGDTCTEKFHFGELVCPGSCGVGCRDYHRLAQDTKHPERTAAFCTLSSPF